MIETPKVRIDKWLWAARFFKTRSASSKAVLAGHILINQQRVKPSHLIRSGDMIRVSRADEAIEVQVMNLSEKRGSASVASMLYAETQESQLYRQQRHEQKSFSKYPSHKRPDKRGRRQIRTLLGKNQ